MKIEVRTAKSYYKYGFIGFIPLIGLFSGIFLLIKAAKFKDKFLSLLGVGSILFTIIFYGWLLYYNFYGSAGMEGRKMIAQYQLNRAMQEIEMYKLANGNYPNNLQDLLFYDPHAPINDPLSVRGFSSDYKFFIYKKINNGYTIFSPGVDQIANDSDDLYPYIPYSDTSRFGLKINNLIQRKR